MKNLFENHRSGSNGMTLVRYASLALLAAIVASCSDNNTSAPQGPKPTAGAANKIVIKGSNTIGEELGPKLIAEYKKTHPDVTFDLESKMTGYGLANLCAGQCDLAGASREAIKAEMEEASSRGVELNGNIIGAYSVAVVVHAGNPVVNLTKEQVRDIFTGTIQNWKEVGGPDTAIHLYVRDPISGTYYGFKELAMENKDYAHSPNLLPSYAAIVQGVAKDPAGIGYSGIDLAKQTGAKAVSINGVAATPETVNGGKYPYTRMLRYYTNKKAESPTTQEFLKFVQSAPGQQIVGELGYVTHP